jgi:hypothetical protein
MVHLVEWELAGETEVLKEYLPQCHFVHNKSYVTYPGIELGIQLNEAATTNSKDTGHFLKERIT